MPDLDRAPSDVLDFIRQVAEDYHPELISAGVTIACLMAIPTDKERDNGDAPHLRLRGYPAAAIASITPYKQRVQRVADVCITIDAANWHAMDEAGRLALIDHELEHYIVVNEKSGETATDKCGRPKIKMKLHDFELGVFDSVIRRHGMKSIDARNVRELFEVYKQQLFSWGDDQVPQDQRPGSPFGVVA